MFSTGYTDRATDALVFGALLGLRFHGFAVSETAAAALTIHFYNGTDNTGAPIGTVHFVAGADSKTVVHAGVECPDGLFVEVVTGTAKKLVVFHNQG